MKPLRSTDLVHCIAIEAAEEAENGYGEDEVTGWTPLASAWASVSYGTAVERRQAAQEAMTVPATFRIRHNPALAVLTSRARILFDGAAWDIQGIVPIGRREGLEITAVRRA